MGEDEETPIPEPKKKEVLPTRIEKIDGFVSSDPESPLLNQRSSMIGSLRKADDLEREKLL